MYGDSNEMKEKMGYMIRVLRYGQAEKNMASSCPDRAKT
jgi:hypothetical protein